MRDDPAQHDESRHQDNVSASALGADESRQADGSGGAGTFSTGARRASPSRCSACCITRAV